MSGIPSIETIIQRQATLQATLPQASVIINGTRVFLTGNQSVDDAAMSAAAGITLEQFQQMKLQQTQFSHKTGGLVQTESNSTGTTFMSQQPPNSTDTLIGSPGVNDLGVNTPTNTLNGNTTTPPGAPAPAGNGTSGGLPGSANAGAPVGGSSNPRNDQFVGAGGGSNKALPGQQQPIPPELKEIVKKIAPYIYAWIGTTIASFISSSLLLISKWVPMLSAYSKIIVGAVGACLFAQFAVIYFFANEMKSQANQQGGGGGDALTTRGSSVMELFANLLPIADQLRAAGLPVDVLMLTKATTFTPFYAVVAFMVHSLV